MRRFASYLSLSAVLLALAATSAQAVVPPTISGSAFTDITTTSAILHAQIDPNNRQTRYHFEWGPASCAFPCNVIPVPEPKFPVVGTGDDPVPVEAQITGLTPGAAYHFRAVAENSTETTLGPELGFSTYLEPQVFEPCANDALRKDQPSALLPDCRAYEQASPTDKNSLDVTGVYRLVKASVNGDAISFLTTAGIPDGGGGQDLPIHLARRSGGQWSTQALLPPQSYGNRAGILGWTPDFSTVFSLGLRFSEPETVAFLARSSAGGFEEVAPYANRGNEKPYFYAGSSADGSKVFFEVLGKGPGSKLTPDAIEGADNLYVYDRDTHLTKMVGVLPDAECEATPPCAPPGGSFAGPYDWASATTEAGGAQRSYYTQEEHAISSDGSSVYFTAGSTGQLYRRADLAGPSPQTARVSASEKENGGLPNGHDAAGTQPAAFQAAFADGKVALLTSTEKLTDDATTGPEPTTPPPAISRADLSGEPSSINFEFLPTHASSLTAHGEYLYWVDPTKDTIGRAKLNGAGQPTELDDEFITEAGNPQYVAVDDEHVYWTNWVEEESFEHPYLSTVARADDEGTPASIDLNFIVGASRPQGIAVYENHLYWANTKFNGGIRSSIARAELNGGNPEQEYIPLPTDRHANALAVSADGVYWTLRLQAEDFVQRSDLDGKGETSLSIGASNESEAARGIALDASHVYWAWEGSDTIGRADLDLENPQEEWIKPAGQPTGLAIDSEHLYFSSDQDFEPNPGNDLYRWDAEADSVGHHLTDLTVDEADPNGAEVRGVLGTSEDASRVYFVANGVLTNEPGPEGEVAQVGDCHGETWLDEEGTCNLYLAEGGHISFIARLQSDNHHLNTDHLDWLPSSQAGAGSRKTSQVSADGRTLLFQSRRSLTGYDNTVFDGKGNPAGKAFELFRFRVGESGLDCVSCNPTGAPPVTTDVGSIQPPVSVPETRPASVLSRALSSDGNRVFFDSTDRLLDADVNGLEGCPGFGTEKQAYFTCQDVYEWEAKGSGTCDSEAQNGGCLYLLSSGTSNYVSLFLDASASGDDVFIATRSRLVPQDEDGLLDIYDARVGGGIASQNHAPSTPCEGEGCKSAVGPAPDFGSPGSGTFTGPPNPKARKPKARCPKGKRRAASKSKTSCVAKKRHRHRKAKGSGRATR